MCECVYVASRRPLTSLHYQLAAAGDSLQYIAAASRAECTADAVGNISQYLPPTCVCEEEEDEEDEEEEEVEEEEEAESSDKVIIWSSGWRGEEDDGSAAEKPERRKDSGG